MSDASAVRAHDQPRSIDRLKPAQRRRAVALALATDMLRDRPQPALVNSSGKLTPAPSTDDVVRLAVFILRGPLDGYATRQEQLEAEAAREAVRPVTLR